MNEIPKSQSIVAPMQDAELEQVSGGNAYMEASNMYALTSQQVSSILNLFKDDLDDLENSMRYKNAIKVLETYDKSGYDIVSQCNYFANSWNKHHSGGKMTPEIAYAILTIENKNTRAKIACIPNIQKLALEIEKLYSN